MKRISHSSLKTVLLFGLAILVMVTASCGPLGFREIVFALNSDENAPVGALRIINDLLKASGLSTSAAITTTGVKIGKINGVAADVYNGTYVSDTGDPREIKKALTDNDDKTSPFDVPGRIITINAVGAAVALYATGLVAPRNIHIGYDGNSLVFLDIIVRDADDRKTVPGPTNKEDHPGIFSAPVGVLGSIASAARKEIYNGVGFAGTVQDLDVELAGTYLVTQSGFGAEDTDNLDTEEDETQPKSAVLRVNGSNVQTVYEQRGAQFGSIASDAIGTIAVANNDAEDADGNPVLQILSIPASDQSGVKTLFTQTIPATADVAENDFVVEMIGQIEFGLWGNILAILEGHIAGADGDPKEEAQPAFQLVSISIADGKATPVTTPAETVEQTSGGFALR